MDSAPSFASMKFWASECKRGRISLNDNERSECPKTQTFSDNIEKVHHR